MRAPCICGSARVETKSRRVSYPSWKRILDFEGLVRSKREPLHSPVTPRTGNKVNLCILGNIEHMPFRFTSPFYRGMATGNGVQTIQNTPPTVYIVPEFNENLTEKLTVIT